tara:strand:- start:16378 stop:17073 length:696 start_codon:yes stop_codon:yes gene_type:complete
MAISIDSVYQQVLAIANKEQRGYITPQEFNLFARKAQLDIFENTFHDYKMALLKPESAAKISDDVDMLREKIVPFRTIGAAIDKDTGVITGGSSIHWLETIYDNTAGVAYEEIEKEKYQYIKTAAKIKPDSTRPIFYRKNISTVGFDPTPTSSTITCDYISKPADPAWGYVVVSEKALYNANTSTDFTLHASEEGSLVNKILELAGISMKKPTLAELALRNEQLNETDKNN